MYVPILLFVNQETDSSGSTSDSRGIPGYEEVSHLAEMLVNLTGLAVSPAQADSIQSLYEALRVRKYSTQVK